MIGFPSIKNVTNDFSMIVDNNTIIPPSVATPLEKLLNKDNFNEPVEIRGAIICASMFKNLINFNNQLLYLKIQLIVQKCFHIVLVLINL